MLLWLFIYYVYIYCLFNLIGRFFTIRHFQIMFVILALVFSEVVNFNPDVLAQERASRQKRVPPFP